MSDTDSDSSVEREKERKKRRRKKKSNNSDSDSDSDSNEEAYDSENSDNSQPTAVDLGQQATTQATAFVHEYNQLRHTIHHLKRYLVEERGVVLPTIHLLVEQNAESLLAAAHHANPDKATWLKWLVAWKEEHLDKAKSRYQLLLQLKADLRCFSRGLSSSKESKQTVTLPKKWREAMLYGQNYEMLMKEKKDKLDEERFRKDRLRKMKAAELKDWEQSAELSAQIVQRIWRSRAAYRKIQSMLDQVWEKVYDPEKEGYYYYNRKTDTATWEKPKLLKHEIEGVY